MNQLSYGQKIKIPSSIVRSVSFDKIREGSLTHMKTRINPIAAKLSEQTKKVESPSRGQSTNVDIVGDIEKKVQSKVDQLRKQVEQKQMSECTFKPKVNKNSQPKRTLDEFINTQVLYEQQKQGKISEMKQMILKRIQKQATFQPQLITRQQTRRNQSTVYDRLYCQSTRRQQDRQNSRPQSIERGRTSKRKLTTFSQKNSVEKISVHGTCTRSVVPFSAISHHKLLAGQGPSEFNCSMPQIEQTPASANNNTNQSTNPNSTRQNMSKEKYTNMGTYSNDQKSSGRASKMSPSEGQSRRSSKNINYLDVQQICDRKLGKSNNPPEKENKKSQINEQLVIKKTLKEIYAICSALNIQSQNLSYLQTCNILHKMNFIPEETASGGRDSPPYRDTAPHREAALVHRKYLYEIWEMLQGDINQYCSLYDIVKVIFSLLGCYLFEAIQASFEQIFGKTNGKKLVLTEKEARSIKANFEELVLNRLKKGQYNPTPPQPQQYPFKPNISKNCQQMAQKYRQRILQQSSSILNRNQPQLIGNKLSHVDMLLLDGKCQEAKRNAHREHSDRLKGVVDQNGQPFLKRGRNQGRNEQELGSRRQELYELGKNLIRLKNQKSQEIVEEALPKQCTFKPNIGKSKQTSSRTSKENSVCLGVGQGIKDFDKSVFRMYEARKSRQSPCTDTHARSHSRSRNDQSPLLYLNVVIGDNSDIKIPVFQGDTLNTITRKVKAMMQNDEGQDQILVSMLKDQIVPALQQIGLYPK